MKDKPSLLEGNQMKTEQKDDQVYLIPRDEVTLGEISENVRW